MPLVSWDRVPLVAVRGVMAFLAATVANNVAGILGKASSRRSIIGIVSGALRLGLFPFAALVLTVFVIQLVIR